MVSPQILVHRLVTYTGNNQFLSSVSQGDSIQAQLKRFRLKGQYHLNNIARTNVTTITGSAQSTPHELNIAFHS